MDWVDVAKNFAAEGVGDEVVLTVVGIESLTTETIAVLVDSHLGSEEYVSSQTQEGLDLPSRMALLQNRPNPFNPDTVIGYEIAQPSQTRLRVYDLSGALVNTITNEFHDIGRYEAVWRGDYDSGRQVSSGVYFYRLESVDFVETRRMTLIR